jgi:hypothetical protein
VCADDEYVIQGCTSNGDTLCGFGSVEDASIAEVVLGDIDLTKLRLIAELAADIDSSYLVVTEMAIDDLNQLDINPASAISPLQVTTYIADAIPPVLLSYDVDMVQESLSLTFSEVINATSFNPEVVSLTNVDNSGTVSLAGTVSSTEDTVTIAFDDETIDSIKRIPQLAQTVNTTILATQTGFILDSAGNEAQSISAAQEFHPSKLVVDDIKPFIADLTVNLTSETFTIVFSELINASSVNSSKIFAISPTDNSRLYQFTSSTITGPLTREVVVSISKEDLEAIKQNQQLYIAQNSTGILFQSGFMTDVVGNVNQE